MTKSLLFVSSLILAAPLAWAQGAGKSATPATPATPAMPDAKAAKADFTAMDANADGKLTREEVSSNASLDFAALDRNGDGSVSRGEFESGTKAKKPG